MLKPTPSKPGLFSVAFKQVIVLKGIAVVALASLVLSVLYLALVTPLTAQAATNNTINFQARLEDASGAIVPDGDYNVEFKLYNVSSAGTAEWTEDYLNSASQGVHVANGYLTVNLGSITSFPSTINWDQQQWLTMNIGGTTTGSVTWDGEMNPRLQITAVPYALRAGTLASSENAGGYQSTLSLLQPAGGVTGNEVFQVPDMGAAGTYTLMTTTTGVQLQSSTPGTAQTGNFNISGTGIVNTLDATSVNVNTTTSQGVLTIAGTTSDSTALGLVINDANGNDLLQVRNDGQVTLGKASGTSSTIGKTSIGTRPDTGYTSLVSADKITTGPVSPTLNSISTWVGSPIDTTNDKYYLGIYTDNGGTPGTLIATSTQGTLTASSWNTLPVSASLSANTSYWLAFFTNTAQGTDPYQYFDTTATTLHAYDSGVSFSGGLPITFSTTGTATAQHSIYASVSETGPLGTTLTVNPTNGVSVLTPTSTTTAFQVQNASGTAVLSADTSNKVVSTLDLQVGTPANTNASRLFSDSFESGNLNLWPTTSGPDSVDTANVHSGKYAVKFSPAGSGQAYIQTHINSASTIDMRGYVYVSSQTTGSISFLTLCDSTCSSQLELYRDSATGKLAFYNSNVPSNTNGSAVMTTGAWHEVEADITINGTTGTVNVYLDGSNVISLTNQNTGTVDPTFLNAGDVGFNDTAVYSMDDIAVDTVRPGDGGNLSVGDSLHVSGTSTFGESLSIQATTDATPALTIYNSDGSAGLQIMSGGSGGNNTFIGLNSGQSNVVNTGTGAGMWNVSLGNSALHSNTSGYQNTAIGGQALQANSTGFDNVAFGLNAMQANTSGDYNSGIGWEALVDNTTGNSNSALGLAALQFNTTGNDNTAVGQSALQDNHSASGSTAVGYQALLNNNSGSTGGANNTAIGQYALLDNTSGSQVTGLGWGAGAINTTGSYNTYVGYNSGNVDGENFSTVATLQNATAIGSQSEVQASNSLVLGGAGSSQVNVGIGTTIPLNTFSVSPLDYNTGGASVASAGTTVTGSGTLWRPSMVGEQFIFSNGQTGIITAVTSNTSLTLDTSQPITAVTTYRIHQIGLQVASGGTVGIGTYNPTAKLQVTGNATDSTLIQATTSSGGTVAQINANGDVNLGGSVTSATVGKATVGGTNAGGYANMISSQKVTTGSTGGTVSSMSTSLIGISSGSNIQFGIYADASGYPGSLIATSAVGTPVVGTNTLPISATLAPNTTYWFTYWTNGSNNNNTYDSGAPANNWYYVSPYAWPCSSSCTNGMPNSFPVGGTGLGITFNVWANYEPASALRISGANGSATFQNLTNSSSAFQIQNASGANLLIADTANMQVTTDNLNVGSAASLNAAGRIFSDGFESGNFNTWTTGLQTSGSSTATIDTSTVHNGKYAVKFNESGTAGSDAYLQSTFSSTATSYSVRAYIYFSSLPAANLNLFRIYSTASGDIQALFIDNTGKLGVTNNGTGLGTNGTSLSTGAWHEVEMRVTLGTGTSGAVSVYLDGVDQHDYTGLTTYDGTNLDNRFRLGEVVSNAGTFWADDFVIDSGTNGTGLAANANVAGSLHVSGNSSFGGAVLMQPNANTTQALLVQNASSTAVLDVDTANNRVGIGTATPSSILDVETNSNTVTAPQITLNQNGSGDASIALQTAAQPWYVGVSSANSGNFTITSANADKTSSTFGDTTAESNPDNSGSGYQVCSQYTPGGSGTETVSSMSVYIGSAADVAPNNLYQVAIYTDSSGPSALVAHSASAPVTGNSWNTVTVNATITGGTPYWLCYQKNASSGSLSEITRNTSGTGTFNTAGGQTFGTWGATFPAHSSDFDGYAIYATYSQSGTYNTFGTSLMSLSTIGQATFENSTNSTSAFQVQSATGVNLLGVNTSGSTVNIGATGSTVLTSAVNVATSSGAAQTVTIGSTNGASSTTIQGGSGGIVIGSSTTANAVMTQAQGITNTLTGSATAPSDVIKTTTNSTNAFQVQNSNTQSLFTVDTANNALVLGNDISPIALTVRGGAATGNNVGGSNITFQASNGTGAGGSGSFIFQTGKPSGNAVGVDNTGEVLITGGTSLTMSYATGSQSSRLMVVQLVTLAGRSFTSVTYNGVALTRLTTKTSTNVYEEVWYLVNPASGTNNLVATENTSGEASMEAATFYNVDQTTPLGTSATASGTTSGIQPTSLNVSTSTSAQLVIDDIAIDTSTAGSLTNGTGQTQLWDYVAGSGAYISGSAYKSGTGGTVNMSWNVNSADWADIGVPINPTSNSATDTMNTSLVINNAGNIGIDNSNPQYSLDVAGTERIQTTSNSSTAFQVQNSSGTSLFTVDTSSNIITIGTSNTTINLFGTVTSGTISAIQPGTYTTPETWHNLSIPTDFTDNSGNGVGYRYRLLPDGDLEINLNLAVGTTSPCPTTGAGAMTSLPTGYIPANAQGGPVADSKLVASGNQSPHIYVTNTGAMSCYGFAASSVVSGDVIMPLN